MAIYATHQLLPILWPLAISITSYCLVGSNYMYKKVTVPLCIAIVIAMVSGLYIVKNPPNDEIRVGVIAPLSGNFAALGERVAQGFSIAEDELNADGISNIKVIIEDACDAKSAVSAANKLVEADKIDILGGSFCVAGFVPVIPILEEHKIIGINLAPNPDSVLGHQYVI